MTARRPPRLHDNLYHGLQRYFLTICTARREPHFADATHAASAMGELLRTAGDYSFEGIAYCFMPDHVHGLFESRAEDAPFLRFAVMFKQRSAFQFKRMTGRPLWQEGFYDRILRNEESTLSVAAYIIQNPVRGRLCDDPRRYPYMGSTRFTVDELLEAIAWRP